MEGWIEMAYEQRLARAQHHDFLDRKHKFDRAYEQAEKELGISTFYTITSNQWWDTRRKLNTRAEEILKRSK